MANKKSDHFAAFIMIAIFGAAFATSDQIDYPLQQWIIFGIIGASPLPYMRFHWRRRFNLFDWLGWIAAALVGALLIAHLFRTQSAVTPMDLVGRMFFVALFGSAACGVFCVPAFFWDWLPERRRKARPPRRQMPYSAPGGAGDLGFDPAAFGLEGAEPERGAKRGFFRKVAGGGKRTPPEPQQPDWQEETRRLSLLAYQRELAEGEERARQQARDLAARESGAKARQQTEEEKFREALRLFGLKEGYTLAELRAKYRELSKKLHPDAGGTEGLFQQIEAAFRILSKRAR